MGMYDNASSALAAAGPAMTSVGTEGLAEVDWPELEAVLGTPDGPEELDDDARCECGA